MNDKKLIKFESVRKTESLGPNFLEKKKRGRKKKNFKSAKGETKEETLQRKNKKKEPKAARTKYQKRQSELELNQPKTPNSRGSKWNDEENYRYLIANYIKHKFELKDRFKISWNNLKKAENLIPTKTLEQINSHHQKIFKNGYFTPFNQLFNSEYPELNYKIETKEDINQTNIKNLYEEIVQKIHCKPFLAKLYRLQENSILSAVIDFIKNEDEEKEEEDNQLESGMIFHKAQKLQMLYKSKINIIPSRLEPHVKIVFGDDLKEYILDKKILSLNEKTEEGRKIEGVSASPKNQLFNGDSNRDSNVIKLDWSSLIEFISYNN